MATDDEILRKALTEAVPYKTEGFLTPKEYLEYLKKEKPELYKEITNKNLVPFIIVGFGSDLVNRYDASKKILKEIGIGLKGFANIVLTHRLSLISYKEREDISKKTNQILYALDSEGVISKVEQILGKEKGNLWPITRLKELGDARQHGMTLDSRIREVAGIYDFLANHNGRKEIHELKIEVKCCLRAAIYHLAIVAKSSCACQLVVFFRGDIIGS